MKFIRPQWKIGKSGRLIKVIKIPKRPPIRIPTNRILVGRDREKFEIIQLLQKKRKEIEKEKKKKVEQELNKRDALLKSKEKKEAKKAFCGKCKKMRDVNNVTYGVAKNPKTYLLYIQGECVKCGKTKISRILRKATDEEIKAFGLIKKA